MAILLAGISEPSATTKHNREAPTMNVYTPLIHKPRKELVLTGILSRAKKQIWTSIPMVEAMPTTNSRIDSMYERDGQRRWIIAANKSARHYWMAENTSRLFLRRTGWDRLLQMWAHHCTKKFSETNAETNHYAHRWVHGCLARARKTVLPRHDLSRTRFQPA